MKENERGDDDGWHLKDPKEQALGTADILFQRTSQ
jgi:hypothetical protein